MPADEGRPDERRAAARQFARIDQAFKAGDLAALRAAVEDPATVPNGPMPPAIGSCLTYAIYHSPLPFIRELLAIGADPNAPDDGGFPSLFATLSCVRDAPGAPRRPDVDQMLRLLLDAGAAPDQRGHNDYTALHMAVAEGSALALYRLLEAGANPDLRTRIDDCETPRELALGAGRSDLAYILDHRGRPPRRRLRHGLHLLWDVPGEGELVRRQQAYRIRLRVWLADGTPMRWPEDSTEDTEIDVMGDRIATTYVNRGRTINGLFYGLEGMRIGGTRRLELAPSVAYGDAGVPGVIPPRATLRVEITVLSAVEPRS
jgi:uncharacterized protein